MQHTENILETALSAPAEVPKICRGTVCSLNPDGAVMVHCPDSGQEQIACQLLQNSLVQPLQFDAGDDVLVWISPSESEPGVLLGKVGLPRKAAETSVSSEPPESKTIVPDQVVIEAGQKLTLKCGEGLITIREDGKVFIKGKDLVSRATQMNRIKGGAVAIN